MHAALASDGHVALRRLRPADLAAFQAYRRDPEVGKFQDWALMEDEDALEFLEDCERSKLFKPGAWTQIAVADAENGKLLGDIGVRIEDDESEAEMGITLSRAAQGKSIGFGAVALARDLIFNKTKAERILAITLEDNAAARALIDRAQFSFSHKETSTEDGQEITEFFYVYPRSDAATEG